MITTESNAVLLPVLDALEQLLREQIDAHHGMLALLDRERRAIAAADLEELKSVGADKAELLSSIRAADRRRAQITARLRDVLAPGEPHLTLATLAARAPEQRRDGLTAIREELQSLLLRVRRESAVVATAADALSQHLAGLMQSMHGVLSRAGVYGRRGRVSAGSQLVSSLDVKS